MRMRTEVDSLGEKQVPAEAYFGVQTMRAVENFPVSGLKAPTVFIYAYVMVKKAAAIANMQVGWLDQKIGAAIVQACKEVLSGKLLDQFVVDVFQAGAGTSFNMNVNEVLANRTLELLGKEKGDYKTVSPNDHVNMAQSTNDTYPTVMHIATLLALEPLLLSLKDLADSFDKQASKHADTIKSGRTHLQDALPVTVGQEFSAYAAAMRNAREQLVARSKRLQELAIGGTAVGTGVNAHETYAKLAVAELSKMTGFPLKTASNPFEALQSRSAITSVSGGLKELALELIRIANDLRLLSSGPTTGLAEIILPAMQPGSSIMPGKVNPVMAECLDMVAFQVVGNDLAVSLAVQAGQLELNVMMRVMMHNVLQSIQLLANYLPVFTRKCVDGIVVDEARCAGYLDKNPSLAVFLSPCIRYLEAAKIAKQAQKEQRAVKEVALEKEMLKPEEAEKVFEKDFLLGRKGRK
jgi:aspartate ammonia-lyase